jgi:aryl-alcohol dehydrogenase-like predicted oxidoreductase
MSQLALAWVARFPTTSTVILGATKPEQLLENLKAIEVIPKLTPEILAKIDDILGNKPAPEVCILYKQGKCPLLTSGFAANIRTPRS